MEGGNRLLQQEEVGTKERRMEGPQAGGEPETESPGALAVRRKRSSGSWQQGAVFARRAVPAGWALQCFWDGTKLGSHR